MICIQCEQSTFSFRSLCKTCELRTHLLYSPKKKGTKLFLFHYESIMRDLILKAKVENNLHALEFIVDLFLSKLKLNQELISAAAILAMPSSLWSRLNGKYDLAFHLAQSATLLLNLKLHRPPLKVGWHLKKQSRLSSEVRKKTILVPELNQAQNRPSDFLIIDDIHTSGNSFAKLQRALYPKTCSFLGLCYTDQD